MKGWTTPSVARECSVPAEISVEFLLRVAPVRPSEGMWRYDPHAASRSAIDPHEVEFEIEAATRGRILSLHFHGTGYDDKS